MVHPHLKKAYEEFRDAVNNPGGASVIFYLVLRELVRQLYCAKIMKVMVSEKTARLKRDPNYLPVATTEARAPESGSFDWKVYYQSVFSFFG